MSNQARFDTLGWVVYSGGMSETENPTMYWDHNAKTEGTTPRILVGTATVLGGLEVRAIYPDDGTAVVARDQIAVRVWETEEAWDGAEKAIAAGIAIYL